MMSKIANIVSKSFKGHISFGRYNGWLLVYFTSILKFYVFIYQIKNKKNYHGKQLAKGELLFECLA